LAVAAFAELQPSAIANPAIARQLSQSDIRRTSPKAVVMFSDK
jgi:hypothetical protein